VKAIAKQLLQHLELAVDGFGQQPAGLCAAYHLDGSAIIEAVEILLQNG